MKIKSYVVEGCMASDKSSDNYPVMALCDDCVEEFDIVSCNGVDDGSCDHCCHGDEDE